VNYLEKIFKILAKKKILKKEQKLKDRNAYRERSVGDVGRN
jgi:hypothetical protein